MTAATHLHVVRDGLPAPDRPEAVPLPPPPTEAAPVEPVVPAGAPPLTWAGVQPLHRSGLEMAGDLAVIATGPFLGLLGWVMTGEPVGMVTAGVLGTGLAMAVECRIRRRV